MRVHIFLKYFIATVWFVNGFLCKILNLVPRHQEIIERILGSTHGRLFTLAIGVGEVCIAIWAIQEIWPKLNAVVQIIIIALYNILGFYMAPDLLVFGNFSYLIAFLFMILVCYNGFFIKSNNIIT